MLNQTEQSVKIMLPIGIAATAFSISAAISSFFGERAAKIAPTVSPTVDLLVIILLVGILWGLISFGISKYDYFRKGKNKVLHSFFLLLIPILVGVMSGYKSYLSWINEQSVKIDAK